MSKLAQRRQQQKETKPKEETSSGSRIQCVTVQGDTDIHDLVKSHYQGRELKKKGEGLYGRARRLYKKISTILLQDRSANRPKQFKYTANLTVKRKATQEDVDTGKALDIGDVISVPIEHTVSVNVKEDGYGKFDDATLDEVVEIVGQEFVDAYITTHIEASVDFSLVPTDKEDPVCNLLDEINDYVCPPDEDGNREFDVIKWKINNVPNSAFHEARGTKLTAEQDQKLNDLVPMTMAFGR
jgi:hypothetical protein